MFAFQASDALHLLLTIFQTADLSYISWYKIMKKERCFVVNKDQNYEQNYSLLKRLRNKKVGSCNSYILKLESIQNCL